MLEQRILGKDDSLLGWSNLFMSVHSFAMAQTGRGREREKERQIIDGQVSG